MIKQTLKVRAGMLTNMAQGMRRVERELFQTARVERNRQRADRAERAARGFTDTRNYRKVQLREESRAVHLARMYIAGRAYLEVEATTDRLPLSVVEKAARAIRQAGDNPHFNFASSAQEDAIYDEYVNELTHWIMNPIPVPVCSDHSSK